MRKKLLAVLQIFLAFCFAVQIFAVPVTAFEAWTKNGDGKYYNNEEDAVSTLYLLTGDYLLTVYTRGEDRIQGDELIEFLNGSLTFIKET